jgi:hypothetical protein
MRSLARGACHVSVGQPGPMSVVLVAVKLGRDRRAKVAKLGTDL